MSIAYSTPFVRRNDSCPLHREQARRRPALRRARNSIGERGPEKSRKSSAEVGALDEHTIRRGARTRRSGPGRCDAKASDEPAGAPKADSRAISEHIQLATSRSAASSISRTAISPSRIAAGTSRRGSRIPKSSRSHQYRQGARWTEIALKGSERFRKEAWQEAQLADSAFAAMPQATLSARSSSAAWA